jgi:hypothetical protein
LLQCAGRRKGDKPADEEWSDSTTEHLSENLLSENA